MLLYDEYLGWQVTVEHGVEETAKAFPRRSAISSMASHLQSSWPEGKFLSIISTGASLPYFVNQLEDVCHWFFKPKFSNLFRLAFFQTSLFVRCKCLLFLVSSAEKHAIDSWSTAAKEEIRFAEGKVVCLLNSFFSCFLKRPNHRVIPFFHFLTRNFSRFMLLWLSFGRVFFCLRHLHFTYFPQVFRGMRSARESRSRVREILPFRGEEQQQLVRIEILLHIWLWQRAVSCWCCSD